MRGLTRGDIYLAFDTSTRRGSVAVARGGGILSRAVLERQGAHAAELLPRIVAALSEAAVDRHDVDGILVGSGPGSFTGLRVAAATAKGLAAGLDVPLWAFSSLAAAAVAEGGGPETSGAGGVMGEVRTPERPVARWILFDARGDRVYAACYRRTEGGLEALVEPRASRVGVVLAEAVGAEERPAFAGDGALRHAQRIEEAGFPVLAPPLGVPSGEALLRLLALRPDTPPVEDPGRWEPEYLRASSAERARRSR